MPCCKDCVQMCDILRCASNIYIGKISSLSTSVDIFFENVSTGRILKITQTSTPAGVVIAPATGALGEFINTSSEINVWMTLNGSQDKLSIKPYTDADSDTFSTTGYDCLSFMTQHFFDIYGYMYAAANQKLVIAQ